MLCKVGDLRVVLCTCEERRFNDAGPSLCSEWQQGSAQAGQAGQAARRWFRPRHDIQGAGSRQSGRCSPRAPAGHSQPREPGGERARTLCRFHTHTAYIRAARSIVACVIPRSPERTHVLSVPCFDHVLLRGRVPPPCAKVKAAGTLIDTM